MALIDEADKNQKKKIAALQKDKSALEERIAKIDAVMSTVGGHLTEEQAKDLILKKLYDFIDRELTRYLEAEKRRLIQLVENLWDKYAVSSRSLETEHTETLQKLDEFLKGLGYV
ncbi:MAG: hypothetical protein WA705_15630 [Candidatus Ozemobacteraceae bacterium]